MCVRESHRFLFRPASVQEREEPACACACVQPSPTSTLRAHTLVSPRKAVSFLAGKRKKRRVKENIHDALQEASSLRFSFFECVCVSAPFQLLSSHPTPSSLQHLHVFHFPVEGGGGWGGGGRDDDDRGPPHNTAHFSAFACDSLLGVYLRFYRSHALL